MSARANSFRSVMVDGLCVAAVVVLFAAATTTFAQGADIAPDPRFTDDHVDSRQNTDDNMPSGRAAESGADVRQTIMLGMKLVERAEGDIRVVDVTAASPAWEAGIRRGDRLLSVDNIKPVSLARWVDDLAKILADREDGKGVAAEVDRGGEMLSLRVRLPESRAVEAREIRKDQEAANEIEMQNNQQMRQGGPGNAGGPIVSAGDATESYGHGPYGRGYGGGGVVGGGFGDEQSNNGDDRMATSAVAQLMAVNTLGGANSNNGTSGGQVGTAEFQNNEHGILAVVSVSGLPQGSYLVGLSDGSGLGTGVSGTNAFGDTAVGYDPALGYDPSVDSGRNQNQRDDQMQNNRMQNNRANRNDLRNQRNGVRERVNQRSTAMPGNTNPSGALPGAGNNNTPFPPQGNMQTPGAVPPAAGGNVPTGGSPAGGGAGAGASGDAGDGASLANPRTAILAQQLDPQQTQGFPATTPNQPTATDRNGINQGGTDPLGRGPAGNNGRQDDFNNGLQNDGSTANGTNPMGSQHPVSDIGILQVGADGRGSMQNQLEGMAVRNLSGMSVVVRSTEWGGTGVPRQQLPGQQQNQQGRIQGRQDPQQRQIPQQGQLPGQQSNSPGQGIVAAGTIQLREGGSGTNVGQSQSGSVSGEQVDEATRQQRNRSQISDPRQNFNPSTPR